MQARYHWHPDRHREVSEFFESVRDPGRANNTLLHLSDALVRSSLLNTAQMSHIGIADGAEFEVRRIRMSERNYPDLYRLYKGCPSRLRSYILGEVLAEAARFRKARPQEAGLLLLNATAALEDIGEEAYPDLNPERGVEPITALETRVSAQTTEVAAESKDGEKDASQVNGLGPNLLSSIGEYY